MRYLTLVLMILLTASIAIAAPPAGYSPAASTLDLDENARIDVNNLEMVVTNEGSFSRDIAHGGSSGLFYPRGTTKTVVYAAGLWVGGRVYNPEVDSLEIRATVAEYTYEYGPGYLTGCVGGEIGFYDGTNDGAYRVYKINKGDSSDPANFSYNEDYAEWPLSQGAPYIDVDGDGAPTPGVDTPRLFGDQTLFSVYHDGDELQHVNDAGGPPPLGLEVQHTTFAFNRNDPLGNVVFFMLKFVNKGCDTIEDTYASIWSDPDLGGAGDDLVGCDIEKSLGYCYNATNNDNLYGSAPPAVGYDFFQGPLIPSPGDTAYLPNYDDQGNPRIYPGMRELGMSSFNKYINGTDPHSAEATYAYMRGLDARNPAAGFPPVVDPVTNEITTYMCNGDPVSGTGWIDSDANDRRLMLSSGPFTMPPWEDTNGDGEPDVGEPGVQEIVAAIIVGQGSNRLESVSIMRFIDSFAQRTFDEAFFVPPAPPDPIVEVFEGDGEIVLSWGMESETDFNPAHPYDVLQFEGYNIYQLAAIGDKNPMKIATYDVINEVTAIPENSFDVTSNSLIRSIKQRGTDSGIKHSIRITEDAVRSVRLNNYTEYYFAVTAYSYNPEYVLTPDDASIAYMDSALTVASTESAFNLIRATPKSLGAGNDFELGWGDVVEVVHTGTSDGVVHPYVVDPAAFTGDTYEVSFKMITDGELCGYTEVDSAVFEPNTCQVWDLKNTTTGEVILENQFEMASLEASDDQPVIDGFQLKVTGPSLDFKSFEVVHNAAGPVDPPDAGAFVWLGFPVPTFNDPDGYITDAQQVGDGAWGIASNHPTAGLDYAGMRNYLTGYSGGYGTPNMGLGALIPNDYEVRFTEAGARGFYNWTTATVGDVPFEIWNIGDANDPNDDFQCFPWILDTDENGEFNLLDQPTLDAIEGGSADHDASSGANDPYTDAIYWVEPLDATGTAGYDALLTLHENDPAAAAAEVLWAYLTDYDPWNCVAGMMRMVFVNWNGGNVNTGVYNQDMPEPGTVFRIVTTKPNVAGVDKFTFTTPAPIRNDVTVGKDMLKDIKVVPNPYFAKSTYEPDQFNRVLKFTHLPEKCKIRIFNLAGDLIQTIDKDDPSPVYDWNMENESEIPIASGIYVWYLESEFGETYGKMAIFREEERVRDY